MFETFRPMEYLQIDIANSFGNDKLDWSDRLLWFKDHESKLDSLTESAEEPAMFYAGIHAYKKALKGEAIGYPISLDAVCSGLQILSLLSGCEKSAKLCGLVDTGHREDAYTSIYGTMCESYGSETTIQRADTKKAIMTSLYGSTAVPKEIFGTGELLDTFFTTMENEAPGAWELNTALVEMWNPNKDLNEWVLPDNFHAHIKVMGIEEQTIQFNDTPYKLRTRVNKPIHSSKSLGPNIVHSIDGMVVREMLRRCNYNIEQILYVVKCTEFKNTSDSRTKDKMLMKLWSNYKESGFLSARIIDYIDEENMGLVDPNIILDLIHTFPDKPFQILTIHDCFRALPTYGNDLRKQYNIIMSEIAKSNMLAHITSQIHGKKITVNKYGLSYKDVLEANYALS